jgi:alkaline phosphatase
MKKLLFSLFVLHLCVLLTAQYTTLNAHSHNDYENTPPFWLAYNNHFGSIEADIWAVNGDLLVGHDQKDLRSGMTLDSLYIQPIVGIFRKSGGKAWSDSPNTFQLLIDLKTQTEPALSILVSKLRKFQEVFDPAINPNAVRIVITGNRPHPAEFHNYPGFIFFDGLLNLKYDSVQIERVPLYSENFRKFSTWSGSGEITSKEELRLRNTIDSVHSIKKKIRFWNSPDDFNAWKTFMQMGVDYINTDHIEKLGNYLNSTVN